MRRLNKSTCGTLKALLILAAVIIPLVFSPMVPVSAQVPGQIKVSSPDTSKYPEISFSFWPFDNDGNFVNDITSSSLNIFENDQQVRIKSLQLLEPGTHFVMAVNEATTLANSYAGKTRLAYIKEAWQTWAKDQSITTMDDFTLINNDSVLQEQLDTPSAWVDAIDNYQPDLKAATSTLNCLTVAIDKLSNLADNETKAVLLITPLPNDNQLSLIQDAVSRATASNIHLFIWLVGPQTYAAENAATVLQQAAGSTEGSFFLFSGAETLPSIESYLEPLHFKYQAVYDTSIQASGTYSLMVQVDQEDFQKSSDKVSFDIKVSPPNPIFLSPPSSITRTWKQDTETKKWSLIPTQQTIKFMLEFPDGHTRKLKTSQLYVDGVMVKENTAEPFEEFKWDLSKYTESSSHKLQIKVEDEAGLTAQTIEIPVSVTVKQKPLNFFQRLIDNIGWQTLGISIFLILCAAGLIVLFLRLRLRIPEDEKKRKKAQNDPLHQMVTPEESDEPITQPQSRENAVKKDTARLVYLGGGESTLISNSVFPLPEHGAKIGSDSVRCDIVLNGSTVSPVHAEIVVDHLQNYSIADRGSAAGTWVNYAPVSSQGTRLDPGDMVHIGTWAFRFELTGAKKRSIQVLPYKE